MPAVTVETLIAAREEVCFDLARDVRIHEQTTAGTNERVVEAPASGLLELGDIVTFEARHFGITQRLTSKIVSYDRPREFIDEMQRGAFKRLRHVHRFESHDGNTLMVDVLEFECPFGPIGWAFDRLLLNPYMRQFLVKRGQELKRIAEERVKSE